MSGFFFQVNSAVRSLCALTLATLSPHMSPLEFIVVLYFVCVCLCVLNKVWQNYENKKSDLFISNALSKMKAFANDLQQTNK